MSITITPGKCHNLKNLFSKSNTSFFLYVVQPLYAYRRKCQISEGRSQNIVKLQRIMSFHSVSVCWFGWWCRRLDWQTREATLPFQRAFQKQIYERALLYFRLARLTPYLAAYCIRDCRKRMSCVMLLRMRDRAHFWVVWCRNLTIPYEVSVLLLFYSLFLALLSNMYCSSTIFV